MKRIIIFLLCLLVVFDCTTNIVPVNAANNPNKTVIIASINKTRIKYVKSDFNYNYKKHVDWQFESIIGYGKKRNIRLSKKCTFYKIDYSSEYPEYIKTSRKDFQKLLKSYDFKKVYFYGCTKKNDFIEVPYYYGLACKLVIKKNKVVKVYQLQQ